MREKIYNNCETHTHTHTHTYTHARLREQVNSLSKNFTPLFLSLSFTHTHTHTCMHKEYRASLICVPIMVKQASVHHPPVSQQSVSTFLHCVSYVKRVGLRERHTSTIRNHLVLIRGAVIECLCIVIFFKL